VVLGIGNPILGDDGVGPRAVEMLREEIGDRLRRRGDADVELKEVCSGNLGAMEELIGCDEAIIIDSISAGPAIREGEVLELTPDALIGHGPPLNAHMADFASSYELYRSVFKGEMPARVRIYAIAIKGDLRFSDRLSREAEDAARRVASKISRELLGDGPDGGAIHGHRGRRSRSLEGIPIIR